MTTILLNGPPGSGKDLVANYMVKQHGFHKMQFKDALFSDTVAYYNTSLEWFLDDYDNNKDRPNEQFGGLSKRQMLIHVSEEVIKPQFGKTYYGERGLEQVKEAAKTGITNFVFSDCGFLHEAIPLSEYLGNDIYIWHIVRPNFTFEGDSRGWVQFPFDPVTVIHNDGTFNHLYHQVDVALAGMAQQMQDAY